MCAHTYKLQLPYYSSGSQIVSAFHGSGQSRVQSSKGFPVQLVFIPKASWLARVCWSSTAHALQTPHSPPVCAGHKWRSYCRQATAVVGKSVAQIKLVQIEGINGTIVARQHTWLTRVLRKFQA
eukprot:1159201-Pelagomonas_calceolata.AAC.18